MATTFEIVLPFGTPRANEAADAALDEIDRLEQQLSVYRLSSEMSRINQLAPVQPVRAEDGLFQLLQRAGAIHKETGGAYDIASGALIKAWGFFKGPPRVPTAPELEQARAGSGMTHVQLDAAVQEIRYTVPGVEINLGSIGKGYALDRAAAVLREEFDICSAILHGGTSSVLALGAMPGQKDGWPISLHHPWQQEQSLGTLWLQDEGMGTSATTYRHLEHEGRKLGHLLDPRSGWPAEGTASASVVARSAALADALSTAFFVLGLDGARSYCEQHPDVRALLLPDVPGASMVALGSRQPPPQARV